MVEKPLGLHGDCSGRGILDFYRFRDDMCFILDNGKRFSEVLAEMRGLADFFVLKIEDVSTVQIRYLDLVLRRELDSIISLPHLKDPALSRRLSRLSAHAIGIHSAWPKMMLNRIEALSSSSEAKCEYRIELTKRLMHDGCLIPTVSTFSRKVSAVLGARPTPTNLWLSVGYHPWWYKHVRKMVGRINRDPALRSLLCASSHSFNNPVVRVAWKNMLPSVDRLLSPA